MKRHSFSSALVFSSAFVVALLVCGLGLPAAVLGQAARGNLNGKLVGPDGEPVSSRPKLALVPAEAEGDGSLDTVVGGDGSFRGARRSSNTAQRRLELKTSNIGTFRAINLPTGRYVIQPLDEGIFLRRMEGRVLDAGGLELNSFASDAHPQQGLPSFQIAGGLTVELTLHVADAAYRQELARQLGGAAAAGPLQEALDMMSSGDFAGAAAAAGEVVAQQPELAAAHQIHGLALQRNGKLVEAEAALRTAERLDPQLPDLAGSLGSLLLERAEQLPADAPERPALYGEAADHLARAVEANPQAPVALMNNWTLALQRAGRVEQAAAALERLIAADPDQPEPYLRLFQLRQGTGDVEGAMATLAGAPVDRAEIGNQIYNLIVPIYNQERFDDAIAMLRRGLEIAPDHPLLHRLLGRTYLAAEKPADALRELERFLALAPEHPMAAEDREIVDYLRKQAGG